MVVSKTFDNVRIANAVAIIRARRHSQDMERVDLHWKKKAKHLKEEVLAVRQELRDVKDSLTLDKLPSLGPCECLFLNTPIQEMPRPTDADDIINKLSVQRFLKNVRILSLPSDSKKRNTGNCEVPPLRGNDRKEQLALVLGFIMDLLGDPALTCESKHDSTYIHQSVKFVKDVMPHLLEEWRNCSRDFQFHVETSVKKLTSTLSVNIMNFSSEGGMEGKEIIDKRMWNQQIILQLGSVPYIGQQFLLTISRLIAEITGTLVCVDPFHEGVAQTYDNLFFMLQLFERLLSDYACAWAKAASLDEDNLQEVLKYHFQTVKMLQDFGNWSSLVAFYINRITGEIITQLYRIVALGHKAEGSKHSALLRLVESAASTIPKS